MPQIKQIHVAGYRDILDSNNIDLGRINVISGRYPAGYRQLVDAVQLCATFSSHEAEWQTPSPDILHPDASAATITLTFSDPETRITLHLEPVQAEQRLTLAWAHQLPDETAHMLSSWHIETHQELADDDELHPQVEQTLAQCQQSFFDYRLGAVVHPSLTEAETHRLRQAIQQLHLAAPTPAMPKFVMLPHDAIYSPQAAQVISNLVRQAAHQSQIILVTNSSFVFQALSDQNIIMVDHQNRGASFNSFPREHDNLF